MSVLCLLCDRPLRAVSPTLFAHPKADDCLVKMTDRYGVAVDEIPVLKVGSEPEPEPFDIELEVFPKVEDVLIEIFKNAGLERLGGISTGHGWSMYSQFMRCPLSFKKRYLQKQSDLALPVMRTERASLAIGTLVHTFLAVYYQRCIVPDYPLTPNMIRDQAKARANPEIVDESWRVFYAYAMHYQYEEIQPLAVEYGLRDPRNGESCRYDLIAFFPQAIDGRLAGTYLLEHKTSGRFDEDTLDGWGNDGEVLGEIMLWKRLGLDRRFGTLRGVIINILGKQKEPKFHRTIVSPDSFLIEQHTNDLKKWEARIQMAIASDDFPRSRANCINRWGRCNYYSECRGDFR
jgi:hypothetical protein